MSTKVETYKGYEIALDERRRFTLKGRDKPLDGRTFDTYAQAEIAIDAGEKAQQRAKREKIGLDVLAHDGSAVLTIKSIHQRQGTLTFQDGDYSRMAAENYSRVDVVYPVVDWIKQRLVKLADLRKQASEIERELRGVEIKIRRSYSGFNTLDQYEAQVANLRKEHQEKTDKAAKLPPMTVLQEAAKE